MKMRYGIIIYTFILFMVAAVYVTTIHVATGSKDDMVDVNEKMKQLQYAVESGCTARELSTAFECKVFFLDDQNYNRLLFEAMGEDALILDVVKDDVIIGKACFEGRMAEYRVLEQELKRNVILLCVILWGIGCLAAFYVNRHYLRPFRTLKDFSAQVAKGNLDLPLGMRKNNYFGAFTESFDLMREELKRARECEYRANMSKKELVAELSHDIKTPVATIKAACEVLEFKELNEDIKEKICAIQKKADVINQLVNNLFHATMEELEVLKVELAETSCVCITEMFSALMTYGEIEVMDTIPECLVYMDALRLQQVIDNVIYNSYKYAKTKVTVSGYMKDDFLVIQIRDYGDGVPEEELSRITEKYYRGSNAQQESGSGLGLFLVKYFMQKMKGDVDLYNDHGFVVELYLRKV